MQKADTTTATQNELEKRIGKLSAPSKMPGYAWGIPASRCITGSKLRLQKGTSCEKCYACKGRFLWPNVQTAYERRYQAWANDPNWGMLIAQLIALQTPIGDPYFRWFDSGDLQSVKMLHDISDVCERLPDIQFWLPTQERGFVREFLESRSLPNNLVVRVSAPEIGGPRPQGHDCTSTVLPRIPKGHGARWDRWEARVARSTAARTYCPATISDKYECGSCRACWDPNVSNVVYLEH